VRPWHPYGKEKAAFVWDKVESHCSDDISGCAGMML